MTGLLVGLLYVTVVGAGLLVWATTCQNERRAEKALQSLLDDRQPPPPPVIIPPPDVTPLLRELLEGVALLVQGPPGPSPSGVTGAPGPSREGVEGEDRTSPDGSLGEAFIPSWETDETWLFEDPSELEGEWSAHTVPFGEQTFGSGDGIQLPDLG